jgi:hypothetical protein
MFDFGFEGIKNIVNKRSLVPPLGIKGKEA